jgi:hypothetical protein
VLHNLDVALNHALRCDALGLQRGLPENFFKESFVRPNGYDADLRALPEILVIRFRNSHIEFGLEPVLDTANDHTLVLERLRVGNVNIECQESDDCHGWLRPDVGHHFLRDKGFDLIADFNVVEILDADAAFVTLCHFRRIVLEALQ